MLKSPVRAAVLIALALPLGACSSLFGIRFAHHQAPKVRAVATAAPAAESRSAFATEEGRRHLTAGQFGQAIESFQKALGAGEPVAPAANGMGVAFARLGRFELALRYFEQAAAADPGNPRYAENIGRLTRSPAMAMRHDADLAAAALKPAAPAQMAAASPAPGRIERISRGEVRIVTVAPQSAPARSAALRVDRRFQPIVRLTLGQPAAIAPQSFVRVPLPEARPAEPATPAANR